MPSKPRSLAGILHRRRAADAEYNRARRDPAVAAVYRSARWTAVRAQVLRDEPICRVCAAAGRTELATQVDHVVGVRARPARDAPDGRP
jgi:5-methylcytosine-specific restriction protein A